MVVVRTMTVQMIWPLLQTPAIILATVQQQEWQPRSLEGTVVVPFANRGRWSEDQVHNHPYLFVAKVEQMVAAKLE
jgi:hypothetical protein